MANQPHEGADVSCEIPPTGSGAEILLWVEPVRVDHEAAVRQVAEAGKEKKIYCEIS